MQALNASNAVLSEQIFLPQRRKGAKKTFHHRGALGAFAGEESAEESPHDQPEKDFRIYRNVIDLPSECGCGCGSVCAGLASLAAAWTEPNVIS
jgi:hypothetical protein